MSVGRAFEELGRLAGVPTHGFEPRSATASVAPLTELHASVVRYAESCERMLSSRAGRPVVDWLVEQRHIHPDVLRANRVGVDPGPQLFRRASGLPRSGLAAVFPALDEIGGFTYVQARYLNPSSGQPKYDNPASRLGANPRVSVVRPAATVRDALLVCEGLPDAYVAASAGFEAVAVLGAGYPDRRVADAVARRSGRGRVVLAFDNDDAGRRGTAAMERMLGERGIAPDVLAVPEGVNDLSDWAGADPHWATAVPGVRPRLARASAPWLAEAPAMPAGPELVGPVLA